MLPTVEGFDAFLAAVDAIDGHASSGAPPAGRKTAAGFLRDLARRLDEEADYARRHAVRMGRFDLVPLIDRLSESTGARLAQRFGERHDAVKAARFGRDALKFRQAVMRGA